MFNYICLYNLLIFKTIDSVNQSHESRDWGKKFQGEIGYKIPKGWRICGENLYAKHSIKYFSLPSYFLAFAVYDENNICLDINLTKEFLKEINIEFVPIIKENFIVYSKEELFKLSKQLFQEYKTKYSEESEGFVIRIMDSFSYSNHFIIKYVREGHIQQNSKHWFQQKIIKNKLKT